MVDKKQDRKFWGILYLDSTEYDLDAVLEVIQTYFVEWAWILHDKDVDDNGDLKKPHVHWCGLLAGPVRLSTVANRLGVKENYIRFVDKWKSVVRYLVHDTKDGEEKYQYAVQEVNSNFDVRKYLQRLGVDVQAMNLYDAISNQGMCTYRELIPWAIKNGCYSELVRAGNMWYRLMTEFYKSGSVERSVVVK